MRSEGSDIARPPSTPRRLYAHAPPALGIFAGDAPWLESTAVAVFAVIALGIFGILVLAAGRRFRWWSSAAGIRLRRTFRVAFGSLVLAALIVPYAVARAPAVGLALLILAVVVAISVLLATGPRRDRNHSTGEHAEVE